MPAYQIKVWDRVTNAFKWAGYTGLMLLHLDNAELRQRVGGNRPGCESWNDYTHDHYKAFISQCIAASCLVR